MTVILYYSNYCDNSKKLLASLVKRNILEEIHYLCIDNRVTDNMGVTHVVLDNGQQLILPPTINCVPALLLLNRGHKVIVGDEIYQHLLPKTNTVAGELNTGEPTCFDLGSFNGTGVASDTFSFLDMSPEDLSAKGDGGIRQMHHYVTIDGKQGIETPPDTYVADKIGNDEGNTIDKLQAQREKDVPRNKPMFQSI